MRTGQSASFSVSMSPTTPIVVVVGLLMATAIVTAQQQPFQSAVAKGSETFAMNLFRSLADKSPGNFIVSPVSVWSLLTVTAEGAGGRTREELERVLQLGDMRAIRREFKAVQNELRINTPTVQLKVNQAMFTDQRFRIGQQFATTIMQDYGTDHIAVEFSDPNRAYYVINDYVFNATDGRIPKIVTVRDVKSNPVMVLTSAIYFKGQWTMPFDRQLTRPETFYGEDGRALGTVNMMHQTGAFGYAVVRDLNAVVLEMSYGVQDRLKALFFLPRKNDTLREVLKRLQTVGLQPAYDELAAMRAEFEGEDVEVLLPKFKTTSDFQLNVVLQQMGLLEIFETDADLSLISPGTYLSTLIQKAEIEVDEDGTVASAASAAGFGNKNSPPRFNANRPFAYVIIDNRTKVVLFVGQNTQPS